MFELLKNWWLSLVSYFTGTPQPSPLLPLLTPKQQRLLSLVARLPLYLMLNVDRKIKYVCRFTNQSFSFLQTLMVWFCLTSENSARKSLLGATYSTLMTQIFSSDHLIVLNHESKTGTSTSSSLKNHKLQVFRFPDFIHFLFVYCDNLHFWQVSRRIN